jgi:DNA-directed RNA polymerase specialized sigma24 family protein
MESKRASHTDRSLSLGEKAERLGLQVQAERPRILARLGKTLPPQDAEDVFQDACARALGSLGQQAGQSSLRAWFHAVLRSTLSSHSRASHSRGLRTGCEGRAIEPEPHLAPRDGGACACGFRTLGRLKSNYQGVLKMSVLGSRSTEEIAVVEGTTRNNIRVRLHRARAALRNSWAADCGSCVTVESGSNCTCAGQIDGQ